MVKNPPAVLETWVQSLGWGDPLEEDMATHSSILAWRVFMDRGAWIDWLDLLQSKGLSRVFSNTTVQKHQFFSAQLYSPTLTSIHDYWKNHSFD